MIDNVNNDSNSQNQAVDVSPENIFQNYMAQLNSLSAFIVDYMAENKDLKLKLSKAEKKNLCMSMENESQQSLIEQYADKLKEFICENKQLKLNIATLEQKILILSTENASSHSQIEEYKGQLQENAIKETYHYSMLDGHEQMISNLSTENESLRSTINQYKEKINEYVNKDCFISAKQKNKYLNLQEMQNQQLILHEEMARDLRQKVGELELNVKDLESSLQQPKLANMKIKKLQEIIDKKELSLAALDTELEEKTVLCKIKNDCLKEFNDQLNLKKEEFEQYIEKMGEIEEYCHDLLKSTDVEKNDVIVQTLIKYNCSDIEMKMENSHISGESNENDYCLISENNLNMPDKSYHTCPKCSRLISGFDMDNISIEFIEEQVDL